MFKMFSRLFDNVWSGAAGSGQVRDVQKHAALLSRAGFVEEDTQWRKVVGGQNI